MQDLTKDLVKENLIAGVDEAGRGPLAGPVIAAAVILNPKRRINGLADSKLLSEKERERLFKEIRKHALAWSVARGRVTEIDTINILQATLLAMQRAVVGLKIQPGIALIDGNKSPELNCKSKTIIAGDKLEPVISAASIIAKVVRDRIMRMLDKKYPHYGFAQHKGYATRKHIEAIRRHGPSRVHRRTFAYVAEWL